MKRTPNHEQLPPTPATEADFEVWEPDEHDRVRPSGRQGTRSRLTASVPGAVAGVFLVCAMAFGATLGSTGSSVIDADDASAGVMSDGKLAGEMPASDRSHDDKGGPTADESTGDDVKPGDTVPAGEKPGTDPAPAPKPLMIDLRVALGDGGRVRLEWGACETEGFSAWKLVRSTDPGASFPLGAKDTLIAALEDQAKRAFTDTSAPKGKKLWYAVVALAGDGDARHVACASPSRAVQTPAPPPAPKPTEKPQTTAPPALGLTLAVKDGVIVIDFTACTVAGAEVYKVVRSSDSTVKWPAGDNDTLVAAVGMDGKTVAWDKSAPSGKKAWYRVFCVRHAEEGYKVLASSTTKGITAPVKDPAPEPKAMWIDVAVDGGNVVVAWEGCGGEQFSHYRIVRKTVEGSSVVAEIDDAGVTNWVDDSVEVGGTYKYLVQAKGKIDGSYVLLGSTDWAAVTVE